MTAHRILRIQATDPNSFATFGFAEVQYRTASGVPLAFGPGEASASSVYGSDPGAYDASKAADGDPATLFASGVKGSGQFWQYDYKPLARAQGGAAGNQSGSAGYIVWIKVVAPASGPLDHLFAIFDGAFSGHAKLALYSDSGGPANLIVASDELTAAVAGSVAFPLPSSPAVVGGTAYWVAVWGDASLPISGDSEQFFYVQTPYTGAYPAAAGSPGSYTGGVTSAIGMAVATGGAIIYPDVVEITIQARGDAGYADAPNEWDFDSSDDGATFATVHSFASAPWTAPGQIQVFTLPTPPPPPPAVQSAAQVIIMG